MKNNMMPLSLTAFLLAGTAAGMAAKKPNIIYIMCDDMGYGDLGCYGQPYIQTPNIDRMAQEGMRFTQAYAGSPVSAPSRAAFMTGQHSGHGEVRGNKEYWKNVPTVMYGENKDYSVVGQHPYDPDHVILPEIMKDNGYTTGMFGKWAGGYEGSVSTPDKRGIDEFYGYICQFQAHLYYPNFLNRYSKAAGDTAVVRVTMEENVQYPMYGDGYEKRPQYSADMIHREALKWLDSQNGDRPFFGIFTYTLPHAELCQPQDSIVEAYKKKFFEDKTWGGLKWSRYNPVVYTHAQFAAMITRLDAYVGEIMAMLKKKGLDAFFPVLSDSLGIKKDIASFYYSSLALGDSTNDEALFSAFSLSVGNKRVYDNIASFRYLPTYITNMYGGSSFSYVISKLLSSCE